MIKDIIGSNHIVVNNSYNYPYVSHGARSAGMLRWNELTNNIEMYNGSNWESITGMSTIDLSPPAANAINWAMRKMNEEAEIKKLAKTHPAVKIAMDNLELAKQQLDVTIILSKEHEQSTN